jgi:hypothetical protein
MTNEVDMICSEPIVAVALQLLKTIPPMPTKANRFTLRSRTAQMFSPNPLNYHGWSVPFQGL